MKAQNKTMKTIITSNWRPLRRALCIVLLCIAALWAMPRSAHAQLYVGQGATVGEYNATTGAAINASLITGLSEAEGVALSGSDLFVAEQGNNTIGEYSAATGAAINASFITGLGAPAGLALSGNDLFVANQSGTVAPWSMNKDGSYESSGGDSVRSKSRV